MSLRRWSPGVLLLVLAGCGFTGDARVHGDDVLVMSNMAEPSFLDPALQTSMEDQRITLALFEGLTSYDPKTLRPLPGVASSWEVSPDGLVYTFHLRSCRWSNGDDVTSADFVYSWRRVLTPSTADAARRAPGQRYFVNSAYADLLYVIDGARAYHRGRCDDFSAVGVSAPDDHTLVVRLEHVTPWFLELLCFPTFAPVHAGCVERHRERWTRPESFVGNGPFVVASRRLGDALRVERNPCYWDRDSVSLDAVVYLSTDQIDTALDQYLAGESDWVRSFNPKKVRAWRRDPELGRALRAPEFLGTYFYRFNVRVPPLDDARVRRALALATDRRAITRYVTGLGEEPAYGLVPPCMSRFVPWSAPSGPAARHDPQRARALLAEAGHPGGRGLAPITIAFNTDAKNRAIAEAIQQMWRDELGVRVELENREKRVHFAAERAGSYQVSRGSWIGDFHDPMTFLDFMVSTRANNRTGWHDDEYDRLIEQARGEADEARRLSLLRRAEEILVAEEAALLPIFYYRNAFVLRPGRFEGIWDNSRDLHPPKAIRTIRKRTG